MDVITQKLLNDFTKANQIRKEVLARRFGFGTAEEYKNHLLGISVQVQVNISPTVKPTIHNVHILDASGSMRGSKLSNAIDGINSEIQELKLIKEANYTQTIYTFSSTGDLRNSGYKEDINKVVDFHTNSRDMTALYESVGNVLGRLLLESNGTDKHLIKIFTDGDENNSKGFYANPMNVASLIKRCEEKGFTITFVGTANDVAKVTRALSIDSSNTLVHDNTAEGVKASYKMSMNSTHSYTNDLLAGKDVSKGFYKKVGTL